MLLILVLLTCTSLHLQFTDIVHGLGDSTKICFTISPTATGCNTLETVFKNGMVRYAYFDKRNDLLNYSDSCCGTASAKFPQ